MIGTTYQQYHVVLTSNCCGEVWDISRSFTGSQIIREAIHTYITECTNIYIGVKNTTLAHTLGIVNEDSSVNALKMKNAAATTIVTVLDAGYTTIGAILVYHETPP